MKKQQSTQTRGAYPEERQRHETDQPQRGGQNEFGVGRPYGMRSEEEEERERMRYYGGAGGYGGGRGEYGQSGGGGQSHEGGENVYGGGAWSGGYESEQQYGRGGGFRQQEAFSSTGRYGPGEGRQEDFGHGGYGGYGREGEPSRFGREGMGQQGGHGQSGRFEPGRERGGRESGREGAYGGQSRSFEPPGQGAGFGSAGDYGESFGRSQAGEFGRGGYSQGPGAYQTGWQPSQYGSQAGGQTDIARHRQGPKGYTRSDERIRELICERLTQHEAVDVSAVSVDVRSGHVTLEGSVPERRMRHLIEDVADSCWGVREIENRIRVGHPEEIGRASGTPAESGVIGGGTPPDPFGGPRSGEGTMAAERSPTGTASPAENPPETAGSTSRRTST